MSSELHKNLISVDTFRSLIDICGEENCAFKKEDLVCYGYDATKKHFMPDAVVFPKNSFDVASVMRLANEKKFFVIPRGAGSGMTGGSLPVCGGVVMALTRLNRIINIDTDNFTAEVEPGVVTGALHETVEKQGLFYPPDPASSAFSTIGGNVAECSGGPRAVKYGVTRDYILGLEVVLPDGNIIHTGVKTAKGVVGYDLTRLIVGSEGTLGVVTRIIVKLLPLPAAQKTIMVIFNTMEKAAQTVSAIIKSGIIPRKIEYMDNAAINCAANFINTDLDTKAGALLLIEVDGSEYETEQQIKQLNKLCLQTGAKEIKNAATKAEEADLWKARNSISPALFKYGSFKINEDIVVPRSKIPDMVSRIEALKKETNLMIITFGHAGDGNIHIDIMLDKNNEKEIKKGKKAVEAIFDYALELGGTISGEHGIGITKSAYMPKEIKEVELNLMKKIKNIFDPKGILNPGKIFI
ncbi:MAG: FAD-binding protein [Deltaproteobacteria bacterium]|nr:FAD-binding protein [Deltaproteobacteria bacterium]